MATTLSDIRFLVEAEVGNQIDNQLVIQWCNLAQADFMLRIFIPSSTTITLDTTTLSYPLPATYRETRRFRLQSDLDNGFNRNYYPVHTIYNGNFEVPVPFSAVDDLLIDYYAYLTTFSTISDVIDLEDRFAPLYTSYVKSQFYRLPLAKQQIGDNEAKRAYDIEFNVYLNMKKQVSDFYIKSIGIQKPAESGW